MIPAKLEKNNLRKKPPAGTTALQTLKLTDIAKDNEKQSVSVSLTS
jgi:hypothetical protein